MSDSGHWLDDAPLPSADGDAPRVPHTPVDAVAAQLSDVSPAWASATRAPGSAVTVDARVELLGRDRAQGIESIREGWLLHRGQSRVATDASDDLALLVGDWCYANGLCTITDHGTLDDVATLARLVAEVSARATEPVEELGARWEAAAEEMRRG